MFAPYKLSIANKARNSPYTRKRWPTWKNTANTEIGRPIRDSANQKPGKTRPYINERVQLTY
ncbi:hypothetical protein DPMN_027030 [Dreissena polymorpha]|uniref:Uncharacterized protein n=1 Tax=Dreissena polymorpha TaxID=45954 RepID=A0A9D4LUI9_DREPO|nr:hypothetical protein DPMN_027030 [Dreissena polymorpha]